MPTRALAAAAEAKEQRATAAKGKHTIAARDEHARGDGRAARIVSRGGCRVGDRQQGRLEEGVQARAISGQSDVQYGGAASQKLAAKGSLEIVRDHAKQILTNDERHQLAQWILACADGQDPQDRTKVSAKIKELLLARHCSNKKKNW